jgi:hypothetical protein
MAMKRLLSGLICAASLLSGAARAEPFHAPAGAAACVWAALPADMIAAIDAAKTIDALQAATAPLDTGGPERMGAMAAKCGVTGTPTEAAAIAQQIIIAKSLVIMSSGRLKADYHVTDEVLAHAWERVTPAARVQFITWFTGSLDPKTAPSAALTSFTGDLGVTDDTAVKLALFYAGARGLLLQMGGAL